ncbi:MAG: single-stranded-DNA-specific exonuclease RecJ [Patescibacteria group bacterium]|nr:single-stranded-DNA-specific exonuclease RecJ [Patescibacteria group bacterium]
MDKYWELKERFPKDFAVFAKEYGEITAQLLWNRNIKTKKEIENFFEANFDNALHDPFLFKNMEQAIVLTIQHIKAENKIVIYGDYDADGVTASALLVEILRILRAEVDVYIPHRVVEGYGLNKKALETIAADKTKLIITVDGGIRNKEEAKLAKELGMDVIITDHHLASSKKEEMPDCLIVNPILEDEVYPYKKLAGVGVAFKFASALIAHSKLEENDKFRLQKRLLDLVAIGTVADIVELMGENRVLVKAGLKALSQTRRLGLVELLKVIKLNNNDDLDTWNIGFQIAPRLNAAGRMGRANTAFDLLLVSDDEKAKDLAEFLNISNAKRQQLTEEISQAIDNQVDIKSKDKIIIGVCSDKQCDENKDSGQGVIGLVAGRIQNKYYLPTLVITRDENGYKGSGRSIPEFNLAKAVESCGELLTKYGGHPMACGFSLKAENLDKFKSKLTGIANKALGKLDLKPKIMVEAELKLKEIDEEIMIGLDKMAPFGASNAKPIFMTKNVEIVDILQMGADGQHLKFRLAQNNSGTINALAFNQASKWQSFKISDEIDIAYYLDRNEFNGKSEIQMKVVDIKNSD